MMRNLDWGRKPGQHTQKSEASVWAVHAFFPSNEFFSMYVKSCAAISVTGSGEFHHEQSRGAYLGSWPPLRYISCYVLCIYMCFQIMPSKFTLYQRFLLLDT